MTEITSKPWGSFQTILDETTYKVKRIIVHPSKRISLQYHYYRSEHWVIVSGTALVQIGDDTFNLTTNQSVFIAKGVKHRIANIGENDVVFIETQVGLCDENDIVRIEDDWNRS